MWSANTNNLSNSFRFSKMWSKRATKPERSFLRRGSKVFWIVGVAFLICWEEKCTWSSTFVLVVIESCSNSSSIKVGGVLEKGAGGNLDFMRTNNVKLRDQFQSTKKYFFFSSFSWNYESCCKNVYDAWILN